VLHGCTVASPTNANETLKGCVAFAGHEAEKWATMATCHFFGASAASLPYDSAMRACLGVATGEAQSFRPTMWVVLLAVAAPACSFGIDLGGFFSERSGAVRDGGADGGGASLNDADLADAPPEASVGLDARADANADSAGGDGGMSYPERVIADAPLAYWRLGEKTGAIAKDEMGRYSGVIKGSVFVDRPGVVTGNAAMRFDGSSGYIDFGDVLDFAGRAPFSIEAWVLPEAIDSASRTFVSKIAGGGLYNGYSVFLNDTRGCHFVLCVDENDCPSPRAPAPLLARFTHIVATYDGTIAQIYYDGARVSSGSYTKAMINNAAPLLVGREPNGGAFAGSLDEVAIYDRALPEAAIQAHFMAAQ
jgi:hypothetical protein